jgi:hypothetical protein
MTQSTLQLSVASILCLSIVSADMTLAQQPVDFAHDVVPILKKHCVACHGGREAKGSFSMNHRELLVDSGHVVSGKPDESHLLELIKSTDPEKQMPPADRGRVSPEEQAVLTRWIAEGLPWDSGFSFAPQAYEPPLKPRRPELPPVVDGRSNPIDRILDADLVANQVARPGRIDDAAFLRRVHLDLVGLLPTPELLQSFLADSSTNKRETIVRQLLDDNIAYADHWLTFFNDLLRNDYSGTGFITGGRAQVSTWLYAALVSNMSFDQLARELIAPLTPASQGYIDGIRWRGEVSAGQTNEIQFAQSVSQSFLGINMKCASCHDSFIDRWKLDEAYGLAAIYSSRPLEIHRCDKPIGRQAEAKWLFPELGQIDAAASREERLKQLAALMTHPENGRFARTMVNRLWYKMMGRGIVHPLDAMQSEPWNADLLDVLANHLSDNKYDLKSVLFLIATSEAYQSHAVARAESAQDGNKFVYRGPITRRMTAEQFLDGVWQITEAAPAAMDAPIFRGVVKPEEAAAMELKAQWLWGDSAADGKAPAAGETITLRTTFKLNDEVAQGGAIVTCDNGYTLYVNNREVQKGSDWTQPDAVSFKGILKKGDNSVVVVATNAGNAPNPAGLFFEARVRLKDGTEQSIVSDSSWQWTSALPKTKEGRLGQIKGDWKPVVVVSPVASWTTTVNERGKSLLVQAMSGDVRMIRASLLKSDFLMRSLGRPLREQIVSMRPDELTTLEAVDLSNGAALAGYLEKGGKNLAEQWAGRRNELIDHLYQFALCRKPTAEERAAIFDAVSEDPKAVEIEDLLWAMFVTPEFFLVR